MFSLLASCAPVLLLVMSSVAARAFSLVDGSEDLIARGQFKQAEARLRQSIAANPTLSDAHFLLGYVLLRENLAKESLAEYTLAARLRAPTANDLKNVGLDYVLLNDYPDAEKWTLRSLEMNKDDPDTWYSLGRIRYSTGKFQDAIDCFEHALALAPGSVKAATNLGLAYEGLNQPDRAAQAYQMAIDLGKNTARPSAQPFISLAILLLHRADTGKALILLKQAAGIAPDDPQVHEQMGMVYLEQAQLTDAQAQFEKAVSLSPQDPRLHFLLGRVYQRQGMAQKAQDEFARTASLSGTHSTPQK
jgi:tetratricopeptide (TPR) repeat protein